MMMQKIGNFSYGLLLLGCGLIASPIAVAGEWEEIRDRGALAIAVKDNLRPLGFRDEEGNLRGLEIDIARKLGEELLGSSGEIVLVPVTNEERLKVVMEGEVDLAIARVGATDSRSRLVNFSRYYYFDSTGFVTKDPTVRRGTDLQDRRVAVLEHSTTIAIVRHALPRANLVGVESYLEALTLLETGEADAFAGDRSLLTGWVQEYPQYRLLRDRLGSVPLAIILPKGRQYGDLYLRVNDAIARWQVSGWLQDRLEYWGLGN